MTTPAAPEVAQAPAKPNRTASSVPGMIAQAQPGVHRPAPETPVQVQAAQGVPVQYDRSAKVRFQRGQGNLERHHQIIDSLVYNHARDAALLEQVRVVCRSKVETLEQAAAAFWRIFGAMEQTNTFQHLSDPLPQEQPREISTQNLNHQV